MERIDEQALRGILLPDREVTRIEPQLYAVAGSAEPGNAFDEMAWFYDLVICNRLYNRIVWGYSVAAYAPFTLQALNASRAGWILDAGCGSLAFNAAVYAHYGARPVVFLDRSLRLLKIAKSRLTKLRGGMPRNMVFLQGDALQLPFRPRSIATILSLNLLHVFADIRLPLREFGRVLAEDGALFCTTLIATNRPADRYLAMMLGKTCNVAPRTEDQLRAGFAELAIPMDCTVEGNMAFIRGHWLRS